MFTGMKRVITKSKGASAPSLEKSGLPSPSAPTGTVLPEAASSRRSAAPETQGPTLPPSQGDIFITVVS